jgi:hypothetical protein
LYQVRPNQISKQTCADKHYKPRPTATGEENERNAPPRETKGDMHLCFQVSPPWYAYLVGSDSFSVNVLMANDIAPSNAPRNRTQPSKGSNEPHPPARKRGNQGIKGEEGPDTDTETVEKTNEEIRKLKVDFSFLLCSRFSYH